MSLITKNKLLSKYSSFRVGGITDYFAKPKNIVELRQCLNFVKENNLDLFVLGGGSNILIADKGVRGFVLSTDKLNNLAIDNLKVKVSCGFSMSDLAEKTGKLGLKGLHYFYSMPGTVGGAVWMNARCYGGEIKDVLSSIEVILRDGSIKKYGKEILNEFSYKKTPFQKNTEIIHSIEFNLHKGNEKEIIKEMLSFKENRIKKGHFLYPCAGSIFKNDEKIGKPTGALIDEIGLCGYSFGGAQVLDIHGNIIVNKNNATSNDIYILINKIKKTVREKTGFNLEEEIRYVGEW